VSSLGSRLRSAREKKGWSQTYVCQKLGISNSTLSGYERDYREPDVDTISTFAQLYEVSTDFLLGQDDDFIKNQSTGGRAYYGGGNNLTAEEKGKADTKINEIRNKIYIQHPDGFRVFITPEEEKYVMEQLKMFRAFKKQEDN